MVKFFLLASALLVGLFNNPVFATTEGTNVSYLANFERESASSNVREIADWVLHSRDNQNMPFLIIDKQSAKVFVFDSAGQIMGASAVLLGLQWVMTHPGALGNASCPAFPLLKEPPLQGDLLAHCQIT